MGCQQANTQIAHTDQTGSIGPYGPRVETAGTMRHMAVSPRTAQGEGGSSHRAFPVCSVGVEISQAPSNPESGNHEIPSGGPGQRSIVALAHAGVQSRLRGCTGLGWERRPLRVEAPELRLRPVHERLGPKLRERFERLGEQGPGRVEI